MTTAIRSLCFILALLLTGCHNSTQFTDSTGQPVNLKIHPQRWLLINYWATWCAPCKQEIGELNRFYQSHRQTVLLYGVEYDHLEPKALKQVAHQMGIEYPLLLQDPAEHLALEPITNVPVTFIFDPSGQLHKVLQGPQTQDSLAAAIAQ